MPDIGDVYDAVDEQWYDDAAGVVHRAPKGGDCPAWLAEYVRSVQVRMGLRDWAIRVFVEDLPNDAGGQCEVIYGRKLAKIRVDKHQFETYVTDNDFFELRNTIVHELLHCHLFQVEWLFNGIGKQVQPMVFTAIRDSYVDVTETAVDAMATAWAEFFPLPEPPAERNDNEQDSQTTS